MKKNKKNSKKGFNSLPPINWKILRSNVWFFFLGLVTIFIILGINNDAFSLKNYIRNTIGSSTYNAYVVSNMDDNVSVLITNFCQALDKEEQVKCVVTQVSSFYNYTMHNETIRTPTEVMNEGGVCRDATILYATVFRRLGWRTTFNYPAPYHINLIIAKEYENNTQFYNCLVDQILYRCDIY